MKKTQRFFLCYFQYITCIMLLCIESLNRSDTPTTTTPATTTGTAPLKLPQLLKLHNNLRYLEIYTKQIGYIVALLRESVVTRRGIINCKKKNIKNFHGNIFFILT